jgi:two-component system sensor histidine kinase QseC
VRAPSIRRRLLLLLLASLVLVWALMLVVVHGEAREEIDALADARLQQGARTLLALDLKRLARLVNAAPAAAPDPRHAGDVPALEFQVWSDAGDLLLASADAPAAPPQLRPGYATLRLGGEPWRSFSPRDDRHEYWLRVLEPLAAREHPVEELASHLARIVLLALPVLALLTWWVVRHGLRPLARLSSAIAARDAGSREPIPLRGTPLEVQPLIGALNQLLQRLGRALETERAFTADAAHELRTPLAAIKVQAEVALATRDEATRRHAIGQVIAGVNRTSHLVQQLLQLARAEAGGLESQAVDLAATAAECVARRAGEAMQAGVEFELSAGSACVVRGEPVMLAVLVDNLLDNAIKYGGAGGHARIDVRRAGEAVELVVADDGVGVGAGERERLRDRFFRREGEHAPGSGLGLSIVDKVAAAHGASVALGAGIGGRGLGVTVRFGGTRS